VTSRFIRHIRAAAIALTLVVISAAVATAQSTITGIVTNGTVSKPAANAEVILVSLMQGMQESGKTRTDAAGKFSLKVPDQGPHLVRVSFRDVMYNKMVPPGTSTADMTVYEAAKKVDGITVNSEMAYQTDGGKLQGAQFYIVRNTSNPPRTQAGDQAFVITLPEGAQLDAARVQAPGGQPIDQSPSQLGNKTDYAFSYPLRPGETVFRIGFHLPYSGELAITPKVHYPLDQFAVVLPQAINFEAKNASVWESPQHQGGVNLKIASNANGKDLSYRISGQGTLPEEQGDAQGGGGAGGAASDNSPRPGGGIGAPIDAPDPLSRYRLPLLTMLCGLLALGALFMVSRRGVPAPTQAQSRSALLNELKEQLFELEIDRRQGRVSEDDYLTSKAALDKTMERALAKKGS